MGLPLPKPIHEFLQNFLDMSTETGSRLGFGGYLATPVAMVMFKGLFRLKLFWGGGGWGAIALRSCRVIMLKRPYISLKIAPGC